MFNLLRNIEKDKDENIRNFVSIFTFFRIYINNGYNVYTALKEISNFANTYVMERLSELIHEIDEDKSVVPFVNFAHHFDELIVEEMMISIYQMIDDGSDSNYLIQFELIFDKFSELLHTRELNAKDKSLSNLASSSLVGSAYLIIMITVGVVTLIGEMLNGL